MTSVFSRGLSALSCLLLLLGAPVASAGVNPSSGAFYISYTDIAFENGFELTRSYNSRNSSSGLFGAGWGSNFEARLEVLADGAVVLVEQGAYRTRFSPPEGTRERADLVARMVRAARQAGEFGSDSEAEAYAARLADDARFRQESWTALHRRGLVPPRTVPVGSVLVYELYGRETILRTREGYSRIDERGRTQRFDTRGRLLRASDPTGRSTWYHYGVNDRIARVVDDAGNSIELSYDSSGRVVRATGSGGQRATYRYDDRGFLRMSRDSGENVYRFDYDDLFNLVRVDYSDGTFMALTYDPWEQGNGVRTYRARDGSTTTYTVELNERLRSRIRVARQDAAGKTLEEQVTESISAVEPDGTTRQAKLIQVDDGQTTEIDYNRRGQHTRIKAPGGEATMAYDAEGQLSRWATREDQYDLVWGRNGRPSSVTWRGSRGTHRYDYVWDRSGRLVTASRSSGARVDFVYGAKSKLESATLAPSGTRLVWTRDEEGAVTRLELGKVGALVWDADRTRVSGDPLEIDRVLASVRELVEQPQVATIDFKNGALGEDLFINFASSFPQWRTFAALQARATLLMHAERWAQATEVLEAALQMFHASKRLPNHLRRSNLRDLHYDLACAAARGGDSAAALRHLEQVFAAGFERWEHLDKDKDLDSLRALPEFEALVKRARLRAELQP